MAPDDTWITYNLPRTRVRITGSVEEKTNLASGARTRHTATSQIDLEADADPAAYYRIDPRRSKLSDRSLALELSENGLLVSTEAKSTGRLGSIVRNVFGLVTSVVGALAPAVLPFGAPAREEAEKPAPAEDPVLARYRAAHPEMAARRVRTARAVAAMAARVADLGTQIAAEQDGDARQKLVDHQKEVVDSLARLRGESALLDQHFAAWKASAEGAQTHAYEFTLELADLPTTDQVDSWKELPTEAQLGDYWLVYEALGFVLARETTSGGPGGGAEAPTVGAGYSGIYFRHARPQPLLLYKVVTAAGKRRLRPVKRTVPYVVDSSCRLGYLKLGKSAWSEKTAELAFHANGSLKTFKNSAASELAAATGDLAKLPADVAAALKQANAIIDERQKLSLQGLEQRIAELEQRKKLVESEIAYDGALAGREQQAELKRLANEIDLLKKRKELGDAARELEAQASTDRVRLETDLLKVQVELEKARVERLKVEAELEKLQSGEE